MVSSSTLGVATSLTIVPFGTAGTANVPFKFFEIGGVTPVDARRNVSVDAAASSRPAFLTLTLMVRDPP